MDLFNKCAGGLVGYGGKKCPCCFDYRTSRGKKKGFSKIRRSRFKQVTFKQILEDCLV